MLYEFDECVNKIFITKTIAITNCLFNLENYKTFKDSHFYYKGTRTID